MATVQITDANAHIVNQTLNQTADTGIVSKIVKLRKIVLVAIQFGAAALFMLAGYAKIAGSPAMVQTFQQIGYGEWFRYLTGAIEFGAGALLLTPGLLGAAALILAVVMAGAVLTHVFLLGTSPMIPVALFVVMTWLAYFRKNDAQAVYQTFCARFKNKS